MKKFIKRLFFTFILCCLFSSIGIMVVHAQISSKLSKASRVQVKEVKQSDPGDPINILLVGSDTRENIDKSETGKFGTVAKAGAGQRSDTMMIMRVDPRTKKTTVVSLPRDLWVDIPGAWSAKINAAFNSDFIKGGGANKLIETIKDNFNIEINHYIQVDFQSFREIVDLMGTVKVCFPAPARDWGYDPGDGKYKNFTGLNIKTAGCQELNGEQSLQYVRSRHYQEYVDGAWKSDPQSDLSRIQRQQAFMRTIATQAIQKGFTDLKLGNSIADSVLSKLTIDQNLSRSDIFTLVEAFQGVDVNDPKQVLFTTVPAVNAFRDNQSVLIIKETEAEPIFELLRGNSQSAASVKDDIDPSQVKIQVLNASKTVGLASKTLNELSEKGFLLGGTGNDSVRENTEIRYTADNLASAKLVEQYISGKLVEVSSQSVDVVVVLGKDFTGIK